MFWVVNYMTRALTSLLCFTDFKDDPYIYAFDSLKYIGIELWQVGSDCRITLVILFRKTEQIVIPFLMSAG